jgi:hypothetical protein
MINEYIVRSGPMICASAKAEERKYHMIQKGSITWLYAEQPNAADNVYYHDANSKDSRGFAGRSITFPLVIGGSIELQGPWHSTAEALLNSTNIDITDTYLHQVIVAMHMKHEQFDGEYGPIFLPVLRGIFHVDEKPVIGRSNRGNEIARGIANTIGKTVRLYVRTSSGSLLSWEDPDKEKS